MPGPTDPSRRAPWWPAIALSGVFLLAAIPLILFGGLRARPGWDHYNFHEPMIRAFARTWPRADLDNYLSATTPLYHWLLAGFARYVSDSRIALQCVGCLFTVALLALLARACVRSMPDRPGRAFAACLPFAASLFVFPSGVWLLPDNAAWLGVLGVLLITLRRDFGTVHMLGAAAVLLLLVLTRQIHIWAAGLIWAAAWIGADRGDSPGARAPDMTGAFLPLADLLRPRPDRFARAAAAFVVTLPAFAVLYIFWRIWGGLIVPRYQGFYSGWGATAPAFGLTLIAIYSIFFGGWLLPHIGAIVRRHKGALAAAVAIGLLLGALPVSTYSVEGGRFGGVWALARSGAPGGRSLLLLLGAPAGAALLVLWLARLAVRDRVILLTAFVAFESAQAMSPMVWQRYQEPFLLMLVILAATRARAGLRGANESGAVRAAAVAGPLLLAALSAAANAGAIWKSPDASTEPRAPISSPRYRGPPDPVPEVYTEEPLPPR